MEHLNSEIFQAFQNKLKTGNRRGVHLNAIPGNSRYKFDIGRLSEIHKSLPEHFIIHLLTQKNVNFKFSIHDKISDNSSEEKKDRIYLYDDVEDEAEDAGSTPTRMKDISGFEKLTSSLENLIFQNDVIQSEKGINSMGFGFPILVRRDMDGQISASPIVIWSVKVKPVNELNTWEISRTEDDAIYVNEVLINHLQTDSSITVEQIPEEMLADGKIDKPELLKICHALLDQLKITQNLDFILNNYEEIPLIKPKSFYEEQLREKGDSVIIKSGLLSIFEVQKQNIINDYEALKTDFKPLDSLGKSDFQSISSIETDPSQQGILEALRCQNKILIQGPPGTGKSQTLTAVLVNALENRQKTIVVCEKQTALEVLYHSLQKIGLDRYCIMIKDSVSDRKLVVDAVRNTIDSSDFKKKEEGFSEKSLQNVLGEILQHKGSINHVHELLNSELISGKDWSQVVAEILDYEAKKEPVDLDLVPFNFSNEEYKDLEIIVEKGQELYRNYQPFVNSSFLNSEKLVLDNFHTTVQNLDDAFKKYESAWHEIQNLIQEFRPIYQQKQKLDVTSNLQKVNRLINEMEIVSALLNQNSDEFHPEITKGFFYKLSSLFSSSKKQAIRNQNKIREICQSLKEVSLNEFFPSINLSSDLWANRNEILNYRHLIQNVENDLQVNLEEEFSKTDFLNNVNSTVSGKETELISQRIQQLKKTILNDGWLKNTDFGNSYPGFKSGFNSVLNQFKSFRNNPENPLLNEYNWFVFYQPLTLLQKKVVEILEPITYWRETFYSAYYAKILARKSDSALNFNENNYTEIKKKLKQFGTVQKSFTSYVWNTNQQAAVKNFETVHKDITVANLYNKRSSVNHKRLTLRQIVEKDIDLFTNFFPIILTTPDACSNLFKGKNFYFDNVVFDEASQLKLEDNLPAMLKAKTIIVAGDEHQMPPSSYFSKVFDGVIDDEDDIETENESITYKNTLLNIESLLDYATEAQFEKNHLDFHYRSRHPYLIDFSNHAFYNSRLKPLPSSSKQKPIEFYQINGVFDDHINREEALKVLEILSEIQPSDDGKYPSVGIATFNISQRNYIKREIAKKCAIEGNDHFKEKIIGLEEAGLFIKNLENIQGDERDIIIISTTYGRKPSGKFIQSFGPINHSKGYKLLNVIITRAKEKIFICNSIPEDVFLTYKDALKQEGSNNRKAVLYAYLSYCKAVSEENDNERIEILNTLDAFGFKNEARSDKETNFFIDVIFKRVQQKFPNLKMIKNHSFGGYAFDIFIEKEDGHFIVIELMSKEKYATSLGYLEDIHKEKVLQNNGFEYIRIWSQNCWQNLEGELEKITQKLK